MTPEDLQQRSQVLMNYFLHRKLSLWDAEDLAQDVMLKILNMEQRPETLNAGYLYTVARTMMIDKYREASRRHLPDHIGYPQDGLLSDACNNPDFCLEEERLIKRFYQLLQTLTDLQRTTFIENKIGGVGLKTIADQRAVSLSAVEKVACKANQSVLSVFVEGECA